MVCNQIQSQSKMRSVSPVFKTHVSQQEITQRMHKAMSIKM
jgi:hypothetical protein